MRFHAMMALKNPK